MNLVIQWYLQILHKPYKSNQNAKRVSQIKRKLFAISAICHQKVSLSETGISKSEILIHRKLDNPSVRITGIWPFNNGFKFATNIM